MQLLQVLTNYQIIQFIQDNGNMVKGMEEENKIGKMDLYLKDIGKTIWLKVMES